MSRKNIIILLSGVILLGGGFYWYWTKDTRRINARFDRMVEQLSKEGTEPDIERLTRTAVLSGLFSDPLKINLLEDEYTVHQDQLKAGIHDLRGGAQSIAVEIEERNLFFNRALKEGRLEMVGQMVINGTPYRMPEKSRIQFHWIKNEQSRDWVVNQIEISAAE